MRGLIAILTMLCWACALQAAQTFDVLCYHEVRDDVADDIDSDQLATSTERLIQHFDWLREHGYTPVSIDDLLAARSGRRALPPKAVLLTFDDGYRSFYTRVYPVLKAFGYPAVLALVGSWIDVPEGGVVSYGKEQIPRARFLTVEQIREMQASGLVEMASHSYDLHRGIPGNPQSNEQPAATTYRHDLVGKRYESDADYRHRLQQDLARNSRFIETLTGRKPRVVVWPYGAYSRIGINVAGELGMPVSLTLDDGQGSIEKLDAVPRHLMGGNVSLSALVWMLQHKPDPTPLRVAHVDLDYLYDENPAQQSRNLDVLLERIKSLQINTVYLQAFADPDGDGTASALYFPSRHLPLRADLFNRVAWQLRSRAGVRVYAWMPVLAFDPYGKPAAESLRVQSDAKEDASPGYRRLSPFNAEARRMVQDIYEDLARHATFDGLLFHDDGLLDEHEDVNPAARQVYTRGWRLPADMDALRSDPAAARRWAQMKTRYLVDFTRELAAAVRVWRPHIKTARNLYARVIMEPESEARFAQSMEEFARGYDYIAVMAMPYMEGASRPREWMRELVRRVPAPLLGKTVFELQARDWRHHRNVPSHELSRQMDLLARAGARHFGYYPDDFIDGEPNLEVIFPSMSLSSYPFVPEGTRDLSALYSGARIP